MAYQPITNLATIIGAAGGMPVTGTVGISNASLAVTGTFWPTTQPVSGTVTVGNSSLPVTGPLTDTQLRAAPIAVSGTFFQATQPVSIASTVAVSGPLTDTQLRASAIPVSGTFFQATQPVSVAALPALAAGTNTIGTTLGPALTKGTQGTTGHSVQDLKDAGRVSFAAATVIAGVTAVTTEALLSMVPVRDGLAAAAVTSIAVTAGKRLRVQKITVTGLTTAAAVLSARVALRMNPAGAVVATSPIIAIAGLNGPSAVALTGDHIEILLPDGFEISGTQQIGLSHVAAAATGTIRASIIGYEY